MVLLARNSSTGKLYHGSGGKLCRGCCGPEGMPCYKCPDATMPAKLYCVFYGMVLCDPDGKSYDLINGIPFVAEQNEINGGCMYFAHKTMDIGYPEPWTFDVWINFLTAGQVRIGLWVDDEYPGEPDRLPLFFGIASSTDCAVPGRYSPIDNMWGCETGVVSGGYALLDTVPFCHSLTPLWDTDTTYIINDFVIYGGQCYLSKQNDNIGNTPNEAGSIYWQLIGTTV